MTALIASAQTSADTAPMSVGVVLVMLAAAVILTLAAYGLTALIDAQRDDDTSHRQETHR